VRTLPCRDPCEPPVTGSTGAGCDDIVFIAPTPRAGATTGIENAVFGQHAQIPFPVESDMSRK